MTLFLVYVVCDDFIINAVSLMYVRRTPLVVKPIWIPDGVSMDVEPRYIAEFALGSHAMCDTSFVHHTFTL